MTSTNPSTTNNQLLSERLISACVGALLTSMVATPLEVVKVRLQASNPEPNLLRAWNLPSCPKCCEIIVDDGLMEHRFHKSNFPRFFETTPCADPWHNNKIIGHQLQSQPVPPCSADQRYNNKGAVSTLIRIARTEGVASLYNGLQPTLWMSVPATVLYFAAYEELRDRLSPQLQGTSLHPLTSLFAGAMARVASTTTVAPFEYLRTRAQAESNPPKMFTMAKRELKLAGPLVFWRGLTPTLFRDVPFSSVYWLVVESVKKSYYGEDGANDSKPLPLQYSFFAGALGGFVAALVTHPFDVAKTRRQVFEFAVDPGMPSSSNSSTPRDFSTFGMLKGILKDQGFRGLVAGLVPRMVKIPIASAVMLGSYDFGKTFFEARRQRIRESSGGNNSILS